jgi:hypothetical protein
MLANPVNMHPHTRSRGQFPERTVDAIQAIVQGDPTMLLSKAHTSTAGPTNELDILSASQYPYGLMQPYETGNARPKRKASVAAKPDQLYGGLLYKSGPTSTRADENMPLSDQATSPTERPKKRARKTKAAEDDANDDSSKKQRGRPRLDTQDQTAADRRRTQIRLAQSK